MSELSAWEQLSGSLTDGFSTAFSQGIPKWVDAEIERPYEVEQPTRQYEVGPDGQAQLAGMTNQSVLKNPWFIGGTVVLVVVGLALAVNK